MKNEFKGKEYRRVLTKISCNQIEFSLSEYLLRFIRSAVDLRRIY